MTEPQESVDYGASPTPEEDPEPAEETVDEVKPISEVRGGVNRTWQIEAGVWKKKVTVNLPLEHELPFASGVFETRDSNASTREPERNLKGDEVKFSMFQEMHDGDVRYLVNALTDIYGYEDTGTERWTRSSLRD